MRVHIAVRVDTRQMAMVAHVTTGQIATRVDITHVQLVEVICPAVVHVCVHQAPAYLVMLRVQWQLVAHAHHVAISLRMRMRWVMHQMSMHEGSLVEVLVRQRVMRAIIISRARANRVGSVWPVGPVHVIPIATSFVAFSRYKPPFHTVHIQTKQKEQKKTG